VVNASESCSGAEGAMQHDMPHGGGTVAPRVWMQAEGKARISSPELFFFKVQASSLSTGCSSPQSSEDFSFYLEESDLSEFKFVSISEATVKNLGGSPQERPNETYLGQTQASNCC